MTHTETVENSIIHKTLSLIASVGAINWGLVGLLDFNLVTFLLGNSCWATSLYCAIGLAGLYGVVSHCLEYFKK